MLFKPKRAKEQNDEVEWLRARLDEVEETLQAIRRGAVDAIMVSGPQGDQLYTLAGATEPYRVLIEQMNQGATTLSIDGTILYCNRHFADLLRAPLERVIGASFYPFITQPDRKKLMALLQTGHGTVRTDDLTLQAAGTQLPLRVAVNGLPPDSAAAVCMVTTDLTEDRKHRIALLNMMEDLVGAKNDLETTNRVLGREILERQEIQDALEKTHFRLRKFVDANIIGVLVADDTGTVKEANDYYLKMIGFNREEFDRGKVNWRDITPPEWLPADEKALRELRETGTCTPYEKEYLRRDGTRVAVFLADTMLPGSNGDIAAFAVDITDRKRTEEEIRKLNVELEQRVADRTRELKRRITELQIIFETVPVGLAIADDVEGRHIRGNPAIERLTGVGDLGELSLTSERPPPYRACGAGGRELPASELPMQRACRGETVTNWIMEIERPNGETSILQSNAMPLRDESGKPVGAVGAFMDVTETKRAEEALRRSEERFRTIYDTAPVSIWQEDWTDVIGMIDSLRSEGVTDFEGWFQQHPDFVARALKAVKIQDVNQWTVNMFQARDKEEMLASLETVFATPDTLPGFVGELLALAQGQTVYRTEIALNTVKGEQIYGLLAISFPPPGSDFGNVLVSVIDITQRKRAEAALRESEELRRAVTDNSPDAIYVKDCQSRWLMGNPEVLRIVGRTAEEAVGKTDLELYDDPQIGGAILENDRRVLENGKAETFEEVAETPEGQRTYQSTKAPRRDAHGNIIGLIGISRDITARKQAEEALRRSEERFKAIASSTPDHVLVQDRDLRYELVVNPQFGFTEKDMIGKSDQDILAPADADRLTAIKRRVLETGQPIHLEVPLTSRPGEQRFFEGSYIPRFNAQHQVDGLIGYFRDTTERKRSEEQIRTLNGQLQQHAAQLEAANKELESFSYSVSHDLRAPLRAIDGFSRILLEEFSGKLGGEGQEHLQRVRTASQRMGQLIDDLLLLSRATRREMRYGTVHLSSIATEIADGLKRAEPGRRADFTIQPGLTAPGDPNLLRIVLENLLGNAWKFTGKEPVAAIEFSRTEKGGKAFCISDNGAGFDPTYASKLFGAFQRLHTPDEFPGTGIGLATVQRIIHRHGGEVWAEGAVGQGAAFYFTLPEERNSS